MVYAHQHLNCNTADRHYKIAKSLPSTTTIKEKCAVCDAMHYNSMVGVNSAVVNCFFAFDHIYKTFQYGFKSISLILAGGRAPPVSNNLF